MCQISICAGTHALQRVFFCLCILVFVSVCVHLRPLIQHHQDTGLNEGSYSLFPTLLSQQVAHNVLFSLRKLLVFLLFLCSYLFFLSLPLSPPLTLFLTLCTPSHKILVRVASSLETLSHFFVPLFEKWLSALSHQLSGQQKDTITGTQIEPALLLFYLRCHRLNVVHIPFCNACVLGITGSCNVGS